MAELLEGGHYKRAKAAAEERLRANPMDAEAQYALGRSLGALGKWQEAVEPAEKAAALEGGKAAYHHLIGDVAGQMAMRAPIYKQLGWARRAKKEFEAAYEIEAGNLDNLFSLANYLWQAPGLFGGDRKRARDLVEAAKKIDACRGYLTEAFLHGVVKNNEAELGALLKAAELAPRCYDARAGLAAYYARRRDWSAAARQAEDAIGIDGARGWGYEILAGALGAQGKIAELDPLLKRAEAAVPDDLRPYWAASRTVKDSGLASEYSRKYRSQEPEGIPPARQPAKAAAQGLNVE